MSKIFDKNKSGMEKASKYASTLSKQDRSVFYKVDGDFVYLSSERKDSYKVLLKENLSAIFSGGLA